ncbi:hypothetical protein [Chitinophaga defluvii]|uniref:Uncharacterized protein n=1 Tax=Chitinophaga defluvii TaxID=3163343 RepID=A0ABV2T4W0_9BACT
MKKHLVSLLMVAGAAIFIIAQTQAGNGYNRASHHEVMLTQQDGIFSMLQDTTPKQRDTSMWPKKDKKHKPWKDKHKDSTQRPQKDTFLVPPATPY